MSLEHREEKDGCVKMRQSHGVRYSSDVAECRLSFDTVLGECI
jgi:hypothetical protein